MSPEEIYTSKIFVQLGVNKIRLTGGEPLVRKDFGEIIQTIFITHQNRHYNQWFTN